MARLAAAVLALALVACGDSPSESPPAEPALEYVVVESNVGANGRTTIGWSHPAGAAALEGETAWATFVGIVIGGSRNTYSGPALSHTVLANGTVNYVFNHGRDVERIEATLEDIDGNASLYHCYAPAWTCTKQ